MYEMIIIGAGLAGISMAAEARGVGIPADKILILEITMITLSVRDE
jgi:cation diffusion facilitator CzcD-associated flavoprotein CzcO